MAAAPSLPQPGPDGERAAEAGPEAAAGPGLSLTELPGELLELILCCGSLGAADVGRLSCACRRLREACQPRGKVWRQLLRRRWAGPARAGGGAGPGGGGAAQRLQLQEQQVPWRRREGSGACEHGQSTPRLSWGGEASDGGVRKAVPLSMGRALGEHTEAKLGR